MISSRPTRADVGLPEGRVVRTLYAERINGVILQVNLRERPVSRLYVRLATQSRYAGITCADAWSSYPCAELGGHFLYFLHERLDQVPDQETYTTKHVGLMRLDLSAVTDHSLPDPLPVALAGFAPDNFSVTEILRVSEDGETLYANVCFLSQIDSTNVRADYRLCRIALRDRRLDPLLELPGIWF